MTAHNLKNHFCDVSTLKCVKNRIIFKTCQSKFIPIFSLLSFILQLPIFQIIFLTQYLAMICIHNVFYKFRLGIIKLFTFEYRKNILGPPRIPMFGSYLLLLLINYKHIHLGIEKLCKYYKSDVIGFYFADTPTIVVNKWDHVKEALFNPDLDGRPKMMMAKLRDPNLDLKGIVTCIVLTNILIFIQHVFLSHRCLFHRR